MRKTAAVLLSFIIVACAVSGFVIAMKENNHQPAVPQGKVSEVGSEIGRYKNVPAYQNGKVITTSHGKHYANDGYYYGQKWQCVEYVKRFYHVAHSHHMPSVWGHACDFFNPEIPHGELNPARGMLQFQNGGNTAPMADDLLVFRAGTLGHVAIITKVNKNTIEVIQQNVHGSARSVHALSLVDGIYTVGTVKKPAGWLRLP